MSVIQSSTNTQTHTVKVTMFVIWLLCFDFESQMGQCGLVCITRSKNVTGFFDWLIFFRFHFILAGVAVKCTRLFRQLLILSSSWEQEKMQIQYTGINKLWPWQDVVILVDTKKWARFVCVCGKKGNGSILTKRIEMNGNRMNSHPIDLIYSSSSSYWLNEWISHPSHLVPFFLYTLDLFRAFIRKERKNRCC